MLGQAAERHAAWVGAPVEVKVGHALEDAPRESHLAIELWEQRVNEWHPLILLWAH